MAKKRGSPATPSVVVPEIRAVCAHCHQPGLLGSQIGVYSTAKGEWTDLHYGCFEGWRGEPVRDPQD